MGAVLQPTAGEPRQLRTKRGLLNESQGVSSEWLFEEILKEFDELSFDRHVVAVRRA